MSTEARRIERLLANAWPGGQHAFVNDPGFRAAVKLAAEITTEAYGCDQTLITELRRMKSEDTTHLSPHVATGALDESLRKARLFFAAFPAETDPVKFTDGTETWQVTKEQALEAE